MAAQNTWKPHESLTTPPTNLKEAIDWVLRVTGRDGKKNVTAAPAAPPSTTSGPHCLCYLAKAMKDLLYDAKDLEYPGPSPKRNWDSILLPEEKAIVQPVLTDLGLLSTESTSATSTTYTCAGGTEVIRTLIDQLAQGLQKWVGWKEGDTCCLGQKNVTVGQSKSEGIGRGCPICGKTVNPVPCACTGCPAVCCRKGTGGGCSCTDTGKCCTTNSGTSACTECQNGFGCCDCASQSDRCRQSGCCCYLSAYSKTTALWTNIVHGTTGSTTTSDPSKVHLLARIFLGSVCLIWSGLSQLGFLTGKSGDRWKDDTLSAVDKGLGSFMAAMGYDLDRLNQGTGPGKTGDFVWKLLSGKDDKTGVPWKEFKNGPSQESVAEYYSSIYEKAKTAAEKDKKTEKICEQYPLLVLHILASGYFRAGSAGAKGVITPPAKPAEKKDNKPRTIREILYWLSALPYSQGYCGLVERMDGKMKDILPKENQENGQLQLHGEGNGASTTVKRDDITHYLLAACGYCPLVLIGIQGTIEREVEKPATQSGGGGGGGGSGSSSSSATDNRCKKHKKDPKSKRCTLEDANKTTDTRAQSTDGELKPGQVCYGGYHLDVKQFGPLHGMYANGLYGFDMGGSAAQCLDQLRVYVYHCFYQLYFLRKQCSAVAVLGWKSCRYGSGVYWGSGYRNDNKWICKTTDSDHTKNCGKSDGTGSTSGTSGTKISPLMCFLCDGVGLLACNRTMGVGSIEKYPSIEDHMNTYSPIHPTGHLDNECRHCPVPMGWQQGGSGKENHFKDLTQGTHKTVPLQTTGSPGTYPAHCTGNTLSHLLEYYCDPKQCQSGTLVILLRLLACITPTVPRTLGDLFGFYYYIVYIGGNVMWDLKRNPVREALKTTLTNVGLGMLSIYNHENLTGAISKWKGEDGDSSGVGGGCSHSTKDGSLRTLYGCKDGTGQCCPYLSPLSGQQYGQLSPLMAGTYLSWLVYLIGDFEGGLKSLEEAFREISCKDSECRGQQNACGADCKQGSHGMPCPSSGSAVGGKGGSGVAGGGVCKCPSVVSCTGVLPVLYRHGFGYGDVEKLHPGTGQKNKQCHDFLKTLESVLQSKEFVGNGDFKTGLIPSVNQLIYTTRLPWIFVLTLAWLVAVLYLAFGAIWPLDWTHMRSHCRGWFRKGSLSPWEVLMVGKKKGRGILEFFGKT